MKLGDYGFKISVVGLRYPEISKSKMRVKLSQSLSLKERNYEFLLKEIEKDFEEGILHGVDLSISTDNHGYLILEIKPNRHTIKKTPCYKVIGHSRKAPNFELLKHILEAQEGF